MNSLIVERRVENSSAILGSPSKAPGAGFKSRASYQFKIHTAIFILLIKPLVMGSNPIYRQLLVIAQSGRATYIVVWPLGSC